MVAIKDFKMPSCCGDCQLWSSNRWDHYCDITAYKIDLDEENRHAECPLVEAIPKADYEARLKADMVAILTDIQLEIEEQRISEPHNEQEKYWNMGAKSMKDICNGIFQEKIDKLKEEK